MKPVSTRWSSRSVSTSTVQVWPPGRSAASNTVISCSGWRRCAQVRPAMPAPMMAILIGCRYEQVRRSDVPAGAPVADLCRGLRGLLLGVQVAGLLLLRPVLLPPRVDRVDGGTHDEVFLEVLGVVHVRDRPVGGRDLEELAERLPAVR